MTTRRQFITLLGGTVTAWPMTVRAQPPATPVIGFLRSASFANATHLVTAFRQGLKETGFVDGQNVTVEFRSAESHLDRVPALVAELIRTPVAAIFGDSISAIAAKGATTTVPIVFVAGGDPVQQGLVASLGRPGGNVTGAVFFGGLLGAKRLELVRQLVHKATSIAVLVIPNNFSSEEERRDLEAAALVIGQQLIILNVSNVGDIEAAFATIAQRRAGALLVGTGAFLNSNRERVVALAARHRLPDIYPQREPVVAGGLMSYGASITNAYREGGIYVGRILKGEKPADLPVTRSTRFELVLNLKTAKSLGLTVPDMLLVAADEVIE
jgi:ABC-type uncharacterized transport system substrate-binding protein